MYAEITFNQYSRIEKEAKDTSEMAYYIISRTGEYTIFNFLSFSFILFQLLYSICRLWTWFNLPLAPIGYCFQALGASKCRGIKKKSKEKQLRYCLSV